MTLAVADRVKQATATTGTGTLTLTTTDTQFQSFAAIGNGNQTYYTLLSGNGTDWETGLGTYTASGTTLSRDTVLSSSNSGSKISLTGTSTVYCDVPAALFNTVIADQTVTELVFAGSSTTIFGGAAFVTTTSLPVAAGDTYEFSATLNGYTGSQTVGFYLVNNAQTGGYTWNYQNDANLVLSAYDGSYHVLRATGSGQFPGIPDYANIRGSFTIGASNNFLTFDSAGSVAATSDNKTLFSTDVYFAVQVAAAANIKRCFITKLSP